MMIDSGEKRAAPRKQNMLQVDIPIKKKNESILEYESDEGGEQMKFTLLTKRGPKSQVSISVGKYISHTYYIPFRRKL